jgi:hypothetical protein
VSCLRHAAGPRVCTEDVSDTMRAVVRSSAPNAEYKQLVRGIADSRHREAKISARCARAQGARARAAYPMAIQTRGLRPPELPCAGAKLATGPLPTADTNMPRTACFESPCRPHALM